MNFLSALVPLFVLLYYSRVSCRGTVFSLKCRARDVECAAKFENDSKSFLERADQIWTCGRKYKNHSIDLLKYLNCISEIEISSEYKNVVKRSFFIFDFHDADAFERAINLSLKNYCQMLKALPGSMTFKDASVSFYKEIDYDKPEKVTVDSNFDDTDDDHTSDPVDDKEEEENDESDEDGKGLDDHVPKVDDTKPENNTPIASESSTASEPAKDRAKAEPQPAAVECNEAVPEAYEVKIGHSKHESKGKNYMFIYGTVLSLILIAVVWIVHYYRTRTVEERPSTLYPAQEAPAIQANRPYHYNYSHNPHSSASTQAAYGSTSELMMYNEAPPSYEDVSRVSQPPNSEKAGPSYQFHYNPYRTN